MPILPIMCVCEKLECNMQYIHQWNLQPWNIILLYPLTSNFHIHLHHVMQIKKEFVNTWEYKVDNNANGAKICAFAKKFELATYVNIIKALEY